MKGIALFIAYCQHHHYLRTNKITSTITELSDPCSAVFTEHFDCLKGSTQQELKAELDRSSYTKYNSMIRVFQVSDDFFSGDSPEPPGEPKC